MRGIHRRSLLLAAPAVILNRQAKAWFHGSIPQNTLIIPVLGDSNCGYGESKLSSDDVTNNNLFMLDRASMATTPAAILATESLADNSDTHGNTMGAHSPATVGSSLSLSKALLANNALPLGFNKIMLALIAWAGSDLSAWDPNQLGYALLGGGGLTYGGYAIIDAALALNSTNKIWFWDWNGFGCNCVPATFKAGSLGMWNALNTRYGARPILVTSAPPDRGNVKLGGATGVNTIIGYQVDCKNWLSSIAFYVDGSGLQSEIGQVQPFIHYSAASQRGGVDNSSTSTSVYSSGSWLWSAAVTYASGNHVIGSDNFCYNSKINGNVNIDPVTDGGVNWEKQTWQYGTTVSNSLTDRKYAVVTGNSAFYML